MQKQLPLDCPILISEDESTVWSPQFQSTVVLCLVSDQRYIRTSARWHISTSAQYVQSVRSDLMWSQCNVFLRSLLSIWSSWSSLAVNSLAHPALFFLCTLTVVLILLFCLFAALSIYLLFPCFLSVFLSLFPPSSARLCQGLGKSLVWELVNVRDSLTLVLCLTPEILPLTTLPFIAVAHPKAHISTFKIMCWVTGVSSRTAFWLNAVKRQSMYRLPCGGYFLEIFKWIQKKFVVPWLWG